MQISTTHFYDKQDTRNTLYAFADACRQYALVHVDDCDLYDLFMIEYAEMRAVILYEEKELAELFSLTLSDEHVFIDHLISSIECLVSEFEDSDLISTSDRAIKELERYACALIAAKNSALAFENKCEDLHLCLED